MCIKKMETLKMTKQITFWFNCFKPIIIILVKIFIIIMVVNFIMNLFIHFVIRVNNIIYASTNEKLNSIPITQYIREQTFNKHCYITPMSLSINCALLNVSSNKCSIKIYSYSTNKWNDLQFTFKLRDHDNRIEQTMQLISYANNTEILIKKGVTK